MKAPAGRAADRLMGWLQRLRPDAVVRSPGERSWLDDIAARRPWNLAVKAARRRAKLRLGRLSPGITVIIVSWNTREVTADTLGAVLRFSPPGTPVLVIDNASTDGSREMLRSFSGLRTLMLPVNVGHGLALDLGVCLSRTTVALTLDSDALPLRSDWLDAAAGPVLRGEVPLVGVRARRNFAHPFYLAVDVRTFVSRKLSFQVHRSPAAERGREAWGTDAWDTGELMTVALRPDEVAFVERTDNAVSGLPGMTAAGVVYHHGGVSRAGDGSVTQDALDGWRLARQALGVDATQRRTT